jgi:hypothetical protein
MPLIASITIIIGVQFALLHVLAEYFSLYWYYPWLDIPMHLFGGILIVLVANTLVAVRALPAWSVRGYVFPLGMCSILVAWEVFGIIRYGGIKPGYLGDTSLDLVFGILGIIIGYYVARALGRLSV